MGVKVDFLPSTRVIQVTAAPDLSGNVDIDFQTDVYSDGKEDWQLTGTLTGMNFPVRVVGGEPISAELSLGATYFLQYGWRIRPYEADHTLLIDGNIYTEEGDTPYLATTGSWNVQVLNQRSNLIDQIASPTDIADAVWEAPLNDYLTEGGSMAYKVIKISNDVIFTK